MSFEQERISKSERTLSRYDSEQGHAAPSSLPMAIPVREEETTPIARICEAEEALVADARSRMRPAQLVEAKLMSLLGTVFLPVSQLRASALCHGRSHC
jgi:hypothetical protein